MAQITNTINELNKINQELKRLRIQIRTLNSRKTTLEKEIKTFLEEKDQPGLKYQGVSIMVEDSKKHKYMKQSDKINDCCQILTEYVVQDTTTVMTQLLKAMKGDEEDVTKLRIKSLN